MGEGTFLEKILFVDLSKGQSFYREWGRLRASQSRASCESIEGFVRGTPANGFLDFLEQKKWNDPDPKKIRV